MSTVLHELLAVENALAETSNRLTKEVTKTLSQKGSLFQGKVKHHVIFSETDQHLVQANEYKEVQSTVNQQLDFLGNELIQYWDVVLQKELANQNATADIVIDGNVIAKNIPSIVLLGMEKKLSTLLAVYNAVPTLDSATSWEEDLTYSMKDVFRTKHATERQHSVTSKKFIEISPATKEHKAQVAQDEKIDIIGKYIINDFSGAISSFDKAERLSRLTALIRAIKSARQRANNAVVDTKAKFGSALLDYING